MVRHNWLGALILGVILILISNYVPSQPDPLPPIENVVGWILVVVAVVLLIFGGFGPGGGWGYGRRYR